MFWFVLLLILLGGGFYFYQRMISLEQEIRAEQEREKVQQASQGEVETSVAASHENESAQPAVAAAATDGSEGEVDNPIVRLIDEKPGVVQSDVYADLPQLNKKQVQQMIRELVDEGKIRRERLGSSFKLYSVK